MGSKQMPLEESIRVPFIVRYPKAIRAGRRTDALLGPIDIMPTLLSLAGVPCPAVDGKDLSAAAREGRSDQRDALLIMKMLPGDIISTGTPRGVDIKHGDRVGCRIDGFAELECPVVDKKV